MPGFNKTGPRGQGPMTGGGRGRCVPGNQGFGLGRGMGRGAGRGVSSRLEAPESSEMAELKAQVSSLGDQVASLGKTLGELIAKDKR